MAQLRDVCQPFGLNNERKCSRSNYLESLIRMQQIDELRKELDAMGYNVKCVASDLLLYATRNFDEHILRDILKRDLPLDEIQYRFVGLLTNPYWSSTEVRIFCETRPELLRLYLHDESSFPLLLIVNEFTNPLTIVQVREISQYEDCIRRMTLLLEQGADINARSWNEPTPIHLAAECGAWEVVKMLLANNANIDIEMGGTTARTIIAQEKPELVENYEIQIENKTIKEKLYDALYEDDEKKFLKLLGENKSFDVDEHNEVNTFLQLAIIKKFKRGVKMLLTFGADINLMAGLGIEPILLAIRNPKLECLTELYNSKNLQVIKYDFIHASRTIMHELTTITSESFEEHKYTIKRIISETSKQNVNLYAEDRSGLTALQLIAKKGPEGYSLMCMLLHFMFQYFDNSILQVTPTQVLEQFLDESVSYKIHKENDRCEMKINYEFIRPENIGRKKNVPEMGLFYEMSKVPEYSKTILLHPVVQLFLVYKWRKIAFLFILNLILYGMFTLSLSIHVYKYLVPDNTTEIYQGNSTQTLSLNSRRQFDVWHKIGISFWLLIFLREVFQFVKYCRSYVKNLENILEVVLLIFSLLTYLPSFEDSNSIFATAILLTYLELTLLIGRFPSNVGIYITMFTRVTVKSSRVVLTFSAFIFSFAFSFFILFQTAWNNTRYDNLWDTIVHTSGMAIGELNLSDLKEFRAFEGQLVMLLFVVLITIVFMNLLNAIAINDTQSIINDAKLICCIAQIKLYTRIEAIIYECDPEELKFQNYSKKIIKRNQLLKCFNSLFSVNVFPVHYWKYVAEKHAHEMKFDVYQNYISPILYNVPRCFKDYNPILWLCYFYYGILLHCKEDTFLKQILADKKYPNLAKDGPVYAEKLQSLILRHEENLKSLKSQNENRHREMTNLLNGVQNNVIKKLECEPSSLSSTMQEHTEQIPNSRKVEEQVLLEQISQMEEVKKDLKILKEEFLLMRENVKEMLSNQQQFLREILVTELANALVGRKT